jgi:hypothetical protein
MDGKAGFKREWTLAGITYEHVRYRIMAVRQAVPAQNELIGYFDVHTPKKLEVQLKENPHPAGAAPGIAIPPKPAKLIQGYKFQRVPGAPPIDALLPDWRKKVDVQPQWWERVFSSLSPPENGHPIFLNLEGVMVHSLGGLVAASHVRFGETATFKLPPGSYEAKARVGVLGVPITMSVGNAAAADPILMLVTIQAMEIIWYSELAVAGVCGLIVVSLIVKTLIRVFRRGG